MDIGQILGRAFFVEDSSPVWLRALIEELDQPHTDTSEAKNGPFLAQHNPGARRNKLT
jgi:hypothetical protein